MDDKLKEILDGIEIDFKKINEYKEFSDRIINAAKENKWDSEVIDYCIAQSNLISNISQSLYNKENSQNVKENWSEIAIILQKLADSCELEKELYRELQEKIETLIGRNAHLFEHRLVCSVQPNLFCNIVSYQELTNLITKLNDIGINLNSNTDDWYVKSNALFNLIKEKFPEKEYYELSPYFWGMRNYFDNNKINDMSKTEGTMLQECVELLKNNHNLILTGAPGTGKTYLAHRIAEELGATKENGQCAMVQFHPSYDYTDFVEGLRPKGNIGFEHKDGVFKEFCKKVLKNNSIGDNNLEVSNNNFDNEKNEKNIELKELVEKEYYKLIEEINKNNGVLKIPMKTYYSAKYGSVNKDAYFYELIVKHGSIKRQKTIYIKKENKKEESISIADIYKGVEKCKTLDALKKANVEDTFGKNKASYSWAILHYIYSKIFKTENKESINDEQFENSIILNPQSKNNTITNQPKGRNYVFIIDEINRGELSKIFGELFFSIDPGYRGEKGKVNTQYQNLLKNSEDIFKNGFYVPENVYIIGTMNDIDRSVESMDFAMRRRFAFKEIAAESRIEMLDEKIEDKSIVEEAKKRLSRLNKAIEEIEGLNSAYHIGPAYFLKLENYRNDKYSMWENLWNNHIKGVLYEYLRGYENQKNILDKLEKAYKNETEQQEEKTESNNNSE